MSIENVAIAIVFAAMGYFFGRRSIQACPKVDPTLLAARASIYRELFAAFNVAYSTMLVAMMEEKQDRLLSEETKKVTWESLNVLSRLIAQTSFMLPQEMNDVLEGMNGSHLGMSWSERLDHLGRVRERALVVARKDIAENAI